MYLKQSTADDVLIGPFVDITDGATSETGETPTVKLSKNGQALAAKSDVTVPVHDADGYYNCELDATDTNTVGTLVLTVAASATALPVRHEFQVVEEDVYEFLYASGAAPDTQVAALALEATVATAQADLDIITGASGVVIAAAENNAIADAILDRDMSTGTDSGSPTVRTVRQALRFLRNKFSISGGTLTVTKEDDTTASWTSAITTDAAADPITASDPADA